MNNKYPQVSFVFDRRKTASTTVKASVDIRICHNYRQRFISTGVKLYANQWKNGKITNCTDIMEISQTLDKLMTDVRQIIMDMSKNGNIDINTIPERLKARNAPNPSFLEFCEQRATIRKYGKRKDSQERYNRFIRLFTAWGKIRNFEDITDSNIISYDKFLASKNMKPYSKWNNYHRFLNSFILDAIDEGLMRRNPYKWVNIQRDKHSRGIERCLAPKEFKKLMKAKMPTASLERVRDLFVFQTYTCLSYSDLRKFDCKNIQKIKGMSVYLGNRHKTNIPFTIPLLPPALAVLRKYEGALPVISNVKYNLYLKSAAQAAGIDKPVSSHWARHTGATMLLNEGVPMHIISKICGHSSTRITEQVYARLLDETVVDALAKVKI